MNSRCPYPVGHPKIITEDFDSDLRNYFGLLKVTVIPPQSLYIPVLPMRCNGRLVFALCKCCAEEQNQDRCHHTDGERGWTGTFVSHELHKALELGYTVQRVHEVWHWSDIAIHSKNEGTKGLFTEFIAAFLKIKQESSGYPD